FRIGLLPQRRFAFHSHHILAPYLLGLSVSGRVGLLVEHNLHDAGPMANIEEEQTAQIAPLGDPAQNDGVVVRVLRAQMPAIMCALQIAKKIEHVFYFSSSTGTPACAASAQPRPFRPATEPTVN